MECPCCLPVGEYAWFDVGGLVAGALFEHVAAVDNHGWPSLPAAAVGRVGALAAAGGGR